MQPRAGRVLWVAVVAVLAFPWIAAGPAALVAATGPGSLPALPALATPAAMFHANTTSTNWAGYAVSSTHRSVSFVNGSWVQPRLLGKCPSRAVYSSFWVGIDGYNSNSVEQTGTDSDCQSGHPVYYAWYEFYPSPSHIIPKVRVHPGDVIYASVSYNATSAKFTVYLADVTTGASFTTSASVSHAARSSAEWIAEAPSSSSGVLPLARFGTVGFGYDYTNLSATGSATVSGTTGLMGSFSSVVSIDMVSSTTSKTKASTSAVSSDLSSFSVTWKSPGP